MDALSKISPVITVQTNNNKLMLNDHEIITVDGLKLFIHHGHKKTIEKRAIISDADIIINGHTHKESCEKRDGKIFINHENNHMAILDTKDYGVEFFNTSEIS